MKSIDGAGGDFAALRSELFGPRPRVLDPTLPLPRNASRLLQLGGLTPGDWLVASFVGETLLDGPHVFADSGRRYDWEFTAGLAVAIVVKPGIDAGHAIASIFRVCNPMLSYPQILDIERKQLAYVVDDGSTGRIRLWRVARGSEQWCNYFEQ